MKTIIAILITSFVLTAFTVENNNEIRDDLTWLNGNWAGLGYQPSITSPWTIKFFCNVEKKVFTIQYPSLNCQGFWKVDQAEKNRAVFTEQIANGDHTCIMSGTVIVTKVDDNHVSYSYFIEKEGKLVLDSFSTLVRV